MISESHQPKLYEHIMQFNSELEFKSSLPAGIRIMNPFRDHEHVMHSVDAFYRRYYSDSETRKLILGINPGRLGAGATGIPFTDPKRLVENCGIEFTGTMTHEPSSVFVYQLIDAYGGVKKFYQDFLISSICPLGFLELNKGKWVNHNYYDSSKLQKAVKPFAAEMLHKLIAHGIDRKVVFCLGTGKNYAFIRDLNEEFGFFDKVIPVEHPRYIMQYKSAKIQEYIDKYLNVFLQANSIDEPQKAAF